jgi:hypothetical protein
MPTLDEARADATRLAIASTTYRVLLWFLGFAFIDFLAALARVMLTAFDVGAGTLTEFPDTPSDYIAYAASPLAMALIVIAVVALAAKAALLVRIVVDDRKPSTPDPAWLPWLVAVLAVGCWWAGSIVPYFQSLWAARVASEYLAARSVALAIAGLISTIVRPLLFAGAALAAYYRVQAVRRAHEKNAGPYREPA